MAFPVQVEIHGILGALAGIMDASSVKVATIGSIIAEWNAWEVFSKRQPISLASSSF